MVAKAGSLKVPCSQFTLDLNPTGCPYTSFSVSGAFLQPFWGELLDLSLFMDMQVVVATGKVHSSVTKILAADLGEQSE